MPPNPLAGASRRIIALPDLDAHDYVGEPPERPHPAWDIAGIAVALLVVADGLYVALNMRHLSFWTMVGLGLLGVAGVAGTMALWCCGAWFSEEDEDA
jgi:hypothetical protein